MKVKGLKELKLQRLHYITITPKDIVLFKKTIIFHIYQQPHKYQLLPYHPDL